MPRKPRQQTMEASLAQQRIRTVVRGPGGGHSPSSPAAKNRSPAKMKQQRLQLTSSPAAFSAAPSSSFAPPGSSRAQPVILDDDSSSSSADEIGGLPDDEETIRAPGKVKPRGSNTIFLPSSVTRNPHQQDSTGLGVDSGDDDDDMPVTSGRISRFTASSTGARPELEADDEDDDDLPISAKRRSSRAQPIFDDDEEEDEDDSPLASRKSAKSSLRSSQSRAASKTSSDTADEDEDEDEDDLPLITPASTRRRQIKRGRVMDDSDDDDLEIVSSATKRRRLVTRAGDKSTGEEGGGSESKAPPSSARKTPRTSKEKARELLRRKRAGETITEEDLESSDEDEEEAKGVYDTDSEAELAVLNQFDDDEEGVPESNEPKNKKKRSSKRAERGRSDEELDDDDFVVDGPEGLLGVPDSVLSEIPLEFTAHRHKPLKDHFNHAVEWLVQYHINPGFSEKTHDLYRFAWQRLDDEVGGLARSKFASTAWKKEFTMALQARPFMCSEEIAKGDLHEFENCGACGRRNHPAKWIIRFFGNPYNKKFGEEFLKVIEMDSDDEEDDEEDDDVDEDGNRIPRENASWYCGVVCESNAEMTHSLLHWKYELLDWVEQTLLAEGHLKPEGLARIRKMKPKKKYKLVDEIVQKWVDSGVMKTLYSEFQGIIEKARTQSTAGKRGRKGLGLLR